MTVATLPHRDRTNTRGDRHQYSLMRAIRAKIDHPGARLDGIEGETDIELRKTAPKGGPSGVGSFMVPFDALVSTRERRDLTATTGSGAIGDVRPRPWVDLLRAKMVVEGLGARVITGLVDDTGNPKFTTGASFGWVAPGAAPTEAAPVVGNVAFSARRARGFVDVDRPLLAKAHPRAESEITSDLTAAIAVGVDTAAINGAGSATEPQGVLNNTNVPTVALGTDGGAPTRMALADMLKAVGNANGDRGAMAFCTSPNGRHKLMMTEAVSSTGAHLWEELTSSVLGLPAVATTSVPNNLTKGAGTDLTALILGDWQDMLIGVWGEGMAVMVDPFSFDTIDVVRIVASLYVDIQLAHAAESWQKIVDMTT